MLDPTALPGTLRTRALMRQADWAPKSEVGLEECGLLNPSPPARPPVCPSAHLPVRPTGGLPVRSSARPLVHPSAHPPIRVSAPRGPRPRLFRPSACPRLVGPIRPSAPLPAPFPPPSARPSTVFPPRPPRPPRPLRLRETATALYTPPRLPSDHPAPRSLHWAPSLCCAFKDCGTARGSRTSGGWSELREKPLQFFFAQQAAWRGRPFTSRETGLQQQLRIQD